MSTPKTVKQLIGSRSALLMYRDCLKTSVLMAPGNDAAQENIRQHFRVEFEK